MLKAINALLVIVLVLVVIGALVLAYGRATGMSARATPGRLEAAVANWMRAFAVPAGYRDRANPLPRTDEAIRAGLEHFADHCALCHANDGSGNTAIGRSLFPPAPDMRAGITQELTDGELFYIIEEGVRFTGMPAWGSDTPGGEELTWQLVHFIRHLPQLTPAEIEQMEGMNPRPPAEIRQEIEAERFLQGN